jgi:hypothetical protein
MGFATRESKWNECLVQAGDQKATIVSCWKLGSYRIIFSPNSKFRIESMILRMHQGPTSPALGLTFTAVHHGDTGHTEEMD